MKIDLYHNIRWSRYKARVFSAMHRQIGGSDVDVRFFQIADTSGQRSGLSGVELEFHQYPHELLFPGSYDDVPRGRLIRTLFAKVLASDADLVLIPGYDRPEYWGMLLAAVVSGKRRAVFCDSTLRDRSQSVLKGIFKRIFFKLCDGYFSYGQRSRELLRHYGASPSRIYQRCQAAALEDTYSEATARATRVQLAPSHDAPRYLYVGRFSEEKSLSCLLRAFGSVLTASPRARLVLVGAGPEADALKMQAGSLGIAAAVEFAGAMGPDALAHHYASATCMVLPSRSEPWGLVVNEALHYGCPVVVSENCGCVPELVHEGITGYVFRTDDAEDLADKLTRLPKVFRDAEKVADDCLNAIRTYIPERAASEILRGSRNILVAEPA